MYLGLIVKPEAEAYEKEYLTKHIKRNILQRKETPKLCKLDNIIPNSSTDRKTG